MYYAIIAVVVLVGLWVIGSYLTIRNLEEPAFVVTSTHDGYEVRQYQEYIVAEVEVAGTYDEALRNGFRLIADYIFGNNTTKTSIAMTAPVLEQKSEKIAMTVPVITTDPAASTRTVAFVLPSQYTLETLPVPNNEVVKLRAVPGYTAAVLRFTGYATEKRIEAKKAALLTQLAADQVTILGTPQVAQYNPPLSFPFTRRNEIIIVISK
jgi:SOUL heme-binding protein